MLEHEPFGLSSELRNNGTRTIFTQFWTEKYWNRNHFDSVLIWEILEREPAWLSFELRNTGTGASLNLYFGCLNLYFECLNLFFECLNLYFGYSGVWQIQPWSKQTYSRISISKPSFALEALKKCSIFKGPKHGRFSVLVFGPESVSYERSRGIRRWVLREISARIFFDFPPNLPNFPKIKFWGKK